MHGHSSNQPHPPVGGINVDKIGLDQIEKIVLEITRHLRQNYAEPYSQAWEFGAQRAENELGIIEGGQIFLRTVQFLRAIRHERTSPFAFIDARCPKCASNILPIELNLIMSTRYARLNDMQSFAAECCALVGGNGQSTACQKTAMNLARAMENIQSIAHPIQDRFAVQSQMVH